MSAGPLWQIPSSMSGWLASIPLDRPVALLLRHSVRDYLPSGDAGYTLPITDIGERLAREFGALLGQRLRTLHSSPLLRCLQTAQALRDGAQFEVPIQESRLLGDPGAYVIDGRRAITNWEERGHEGVMACLVAHDVPLPGMAAPLPAARLLARQMLAATNGDPGLHVFVTHDSLVTATVARLLGKPLQQADWPWYLEGGFFWQDHAELVTGYRDMTGRSDYAALSRLDETTALEFARRELANTVGCDCPARFFLAGGAFKTLLTGKPPRDLDLWAASERDREHLIDTLTQRGACPRPSTRFAQRYAIADRILEIPVHVEPAQLAARLARFDLALSAIGVEHQPGGTWNVLIDSRAHESLQRKEVLLMKPLANWKYALATLERMRRYAAELQFSIPADEEAEIWRVFDAQPKAMQWRMIERYDDAGLCGYGVREEALCRLP